ncbi:hypothetical protein V6N13_124157 [Hibiscus sabdariffa]
MDKDKSLGLPPKASRVLGLSSVGDTANTSIAKSEMTNYGQTTDSNRFSHNINKMPDNPPRKLGHRRVHSETKTLRMILASVISALWRQLCGYFLLLSCCSFQYLRLPSEWNFNALQRF